MAGEAGDGAGHWREGNGTGSIEGNGGDYEREERGERGRERGTLVDFAEDDNAGECGLGIAWDDRVEEVYAWN